MYLPPLYASKLHTAQLEETILNIFDGSMSL